MPDLTAANFAILILIVLGLEALVFFALWLKRGIGLPPAQVVSFLGAGAAFAGALLAVALDASIFILGAILGGAFVFHMMDILLRWRR